MMDKLIYLVLFFFALNTVFGQEDKFEFEMSDYHGEYLGLQQPDTVPVKFAPGFISIDNQDNIGLVFSPDGKQLVYSTINLTAWDTKTFYAKQIDESWTMPTEIKLSDNTICINPTFTSDNKSIIFTVFTKNWEHIGIYYITLSETGYTEPQIYDLKCNEKRKLYMYFEHPNGEIYYVLVNKEDSIKQSDIYKYSVKEGKEVIEYLEEINTEYDNDSPFLSPDGNILVWNNQFKYSKDSVGFDIMFSFRNKNGGWTKPHNYSRSINPTGWNWRPIITNDEKFLFFSMQKETGFDIYWVSTKVIDKLR